MAHEIVVFEEKHESAIYDIDASGGWPRVCMTVLRRRHDEGYYDEPGEEPQKPVAREVNSPEEAEAASREFRTFDERHKWWGRLNYEWKLIQRAVKEDDFFAAVALIDRRKEAQYEGYTREFRAEVPDDVPFLVYPDWIAARMVAEAGAKLLDAVNGTEEEWTTAVQFADFTTNQVLETQTGPLPDDHRNPPPAPSAGSHQHCLGVVREHVRRLVADRANLEHQDVLRWSLGVHGKYDFDPTALARRRLEVYGSVHGVAQARWESYKTNRMGTKAESYVTPSLGRLQGLLKEYAFSVEAWLAGKPHRRTHVPR